VAHTPTFVSASELTITLSVADQATAGSYAVVVTNPTPGGGTSSATFTVTNPAPTLTSLSPSSVVAGAGAQTLTLRGSNFLSTSTVTYNGVAHTPAFVSASELTITLSVVDQATAGSYAVVVTNPTPGGGTSIATFAVTNSGPNLTSLSPSSAVAGAGAQTLTLSGSNFLSTSTVTYNGVAHTPTFVSASELTITLSVVDQATAGSYAVVVTNPAPAGGTSSATFTVTNPAPTLTSLSPSSVVAGAGAQILSINGTNFVASSTVTYNGVAHTPTFVSASELTITLSVADQATAGSYAVVVTNPTPGGGASSATFAVTNSGPNLTGLSPSSTVAGAGAQTLTLRGSNFLSTSTVTYNGVAHTPTFVSASELTIALSVADQATAGSYAVVETNPTPGGGTSSATFAVTNPAPTLTSLSPSSGVAGAAAQTLSINGTNFVASSTVTYNGVAHTPTFVSASELTITLSVADQATAGSYAVVVTNPTPGGGTSIATFTVTNPAPTLISLSPSSVVAGAGAQTLTLSGSNFLSTSTVTYNGVAHTPTFVSASELTITLSVADQATAGSYAVVVTNPTPGGGASNVLDFIVTTGGSAVVSLSTTSLNFGSQPFLVTSTAQTVALTNMGSATLNITSIVITGANAGDFIQNNNCGSSVTAGGNCTLSVTFFPTSTGTETAGVTLTDNAGGGSPQTVSLTGTGMNSAGQFMTLDATHTYLVNTFTNKPVFMTGEDAWDLIAQVDNADAGTYLSDRASRGFNVLWTVAVDNIYQSNPPHNYYGYAPFDGADFTNEDGNYWAHVDDILQLAASYGLTVGIDPGFPGLSNAEGYRASYLSSSDGVVNAYGAWLGSRYHNYPNILWILAGDADPTDTALYEKLNQLATGIRSADSVHLITFEAARFYESGGAAPNGGWSSLDAWGSSVSGAYTAAGFPPTWLNLNWVYDPYAEMQAGCTRNYTSYVSAHPNMPQLAGEDWYEGEHSMTALQLREESYWEVLSGCTLGRIFGNNAIWTFGGPSDTMGQTWPSQLDSAGSTAQQYLGQLLRSREFWKLVPDTGNTTLTSGYGSGTTIAVASRTSDGQTIMAYVPNGNATTLTVDMSQIASAGSTVNCWWFNPSNGATMLIGADANSGSQDFTPPDANDWVLVIDDASANLAAPGSANL
ncbi:MAG: DUF4038 domain-containing protein, partial [Terriglobia bacterium]